MLDFLTTLAILAQATPDPEPTPWAAILAAVLAAVTAIIQVLKLLGVVKLDVSLTPTTTTTTTTTTAPPPGTPPVVVTPGPSTPPTPAPIFQTVVDFAMELFADGKITIADVPAVVKFLTGLLGHRLAVVTPEAKLAAIEFLASHKAPPQ